MRKFSYIFANTQAIFAWQHQVKDHAIWVYLFNCCFGFIARVDEIDRLMGLGFGADDYVCKPFSPREVVARVQALLRRAALGAPAEKTAPNILTFKHIRIDTERFECTINGNIIELTPVEFRLLKTLLGKPGTVFSREILMQRCYEDARIVSNRTIDSHMKNLRNKISLVDDPQPILQSVYGVGYKLM